MHFHQDCFFFWERHMFARSILIGTTPVLLHCCFRGVAGTVELSAVTHNRDTAVPALCRETLGERDPSTCTHTSTSASSFISGTERSRRKHKHWFLISSVSAALHLSAPFNTHTNASVHICTQIYTHAHTHTSAVHNRDFHTRASEVETEERAPHLFQKKFLFLKSLGVTRTGEKF